MTTALLERSTPAPLWNDGWHKDQHEGRGDLYDVCCLVDATTRDCRFDWLAAALRIVDRHSAPPHKQLKIAARAHVVRFTAEERAQEARIALEDATGDVARWLRGTSPQAFAAVAISRVALSVVLTHAPSPEFLREFFLDWNVRVVAHAARIVLHGYPVDPGPEECDCGGIATALLGKQWWCRTCVEVLGECGHCGEVFPKAELVSDTNDYFESAGEVCTDCLHREPSDGGDDE